MVYGSRILSCSKCKYRTNAVAGYVEHCKLHSNVPNVAFPCGVRRCVQTFKTFGGFKSHVLRCHGAVKNVTRGKEFNRDGVGPSYECAVLHCKQVSTCLSSFLDHIRHHINERSTVTCPFLRCRKKFENVKVSTFNAHLSRYHRGWTYQNVDDSYFVSGSSSGGQDSSACVTDDGLRPTSVANDSDAGSDLETECKLSDSDMENLLLKKLAVFTLNLQVKHHVASSVVQVIISEFGDLLLTNMNAVHDKINSLLVNLVPQDMANSVLQAVNGHPLSVTLDLKNGPLRSEHMRMTYYKKSLNYVEPQTISLNSAATGEETKAFHYIPIMKSLQALLADSNIHQHFKTNMCFDGSSITDKILRDFDDGNIFQNNAFFKDNPDALQILLYQDEFEISNPIGVARGKHKLLAVYYSLGNLHPNVRSKIDGLQLVLLCNSDYLKEFGPEAVFQPLVNDLIRLKEEGIYLGPRHGTKKGAVVFVLGDNLGSHMLGGFVQCFSGKFFCRFCLATNDCLISGKCLPDEFAVRTPERYDNAVKYVEFNDVDCFEGVKKKSVLHAVPGFHVCTPALPPCLGHDLFEGVIPNDVTLCLKYFVKEKKWFSFVYLNRRIKTLKLTGSEANDRPALINLVKSKVVGNAVQVWTFIRFLPLLIGSKIENTEDKVWQFVLVMREVVELVCATTASMQVVMAMSDKIEEYIERRVDCFPDVQLRPKHHFLTHYPSLTWQCGPLIRLWTLRFESKHAYFKMSARAAKNCINVTKTLAEKHQFLQAYYSTGSLFGPAIHCSNGITFHADMYSLNIKTAVQRFPELTLTDTLASDSVVLDNVAYSKGSYLALERVDELLICGVIKMILVYKSSKVYFVVAKKETKYLADMGLYEVLCDDQEFWHCVNIVELLDIYPLNVYKMGFGSFLVLHHTV